MSKFCELARKVTNCTDNCKVCLEEERRDNKVENNFKVGDIVRYLKDTSNYDESEKIYYPPKGTIGIVIGIKGDIAPYLIRWPDGTTKGNGFWYTDRESIELV